MNTIDHARGALLRGDLSTARALAADALRSNPNDPQAWLLFSEVALTEHERVDALNRVLALDPVNQVARQRLAGFAPPPGGYPPAPYGPPAPLYGAPAPTIPVQGAPAAGGYPAGGYPAGWNPGPVVEPRKVALPMKIMVGFVIVVLGLVAIAGVIAGIGGAFDVKTPAIPADVRATGFLQEMLVALFDERFYDEATMDEVVGPMTDQYVLPAGRAAFRRGLREGLQSNPSVESTKESLALIDSVEVLEPTYVVEEQSPTKTRLRVSGGKIRAVSDGFEFDLPLQDSVEMIELINEDGVWYINNVRFATP